MLNIRKVAVLGAGTMGAQIAAHLANLGFDVLLLDIVPPDLSEEEKQDPAARNRIVFSGLERTKKLSPPAFADPSAVRRVRIGNFEDDMEKIREVDWVVEAVVERLDVKRSLFERVEQHLSEKTLVTTNTSGIPLKSLAEGRSESFRKRFFGTHFFNPPRYMYLLELIPGPDTSPELFQAFARFAEKALGKGVVFAKDTPNFIANRIGVFGLMYTLRKMEEMELTVEEVDALTGREVGRPRTATLRLADLVGLDVLLHVARNVYENAPDDEMREVFQPPKWLEEMVQRGWLGDKAGQGFYKKVNGKRYVIDIKTLEYRPAEKKTFPSLEQARAQERVEDRIRTLLAGKDKGAEFVRDTLFVLLGYAAHRIPEIADDVVNVDRAMEWGFNWRMGPFKLWDLVGVETVDAYLQEKGYARAPIVEAVLASESRRFYGEDAEHRPTYFDVGKKVHLRIQEPEEYLDLSVLKKQGKELLANPEASLVDLGDGVACLEFHSKANALGPGTIDMVFRSLDYVDKHDYAGLVIGNQGAHFSAGANLALILMAVQEEEWDELDRMVKRFQEMVMALKYFHKPVVAAPFGRTLGGGTEVVLHASAAQAAFETYMGLVEVAVGLLPAGGGTKETWLRHLSLIPEDILEYVDLYTYLRRAVEQIGMAKVSMGALEARKLLYLRESDGITANARFLLSDAKRRVLFLAEQGYRPPAPPSILVAGTDGFAAIQAILYNMREGNFISDHDKLIVEKIAWVMTGGDVPRGTHLTEWEMLDLEREAFLFLAGTAKTQERMQHMLLKGKPLRN